MNHVKLIAFTKPVVLDMVSPEELVAYCARASNPANQGNMETAPKLLKYLVEHQHWSPFEMAHMVVEIETTRDIARQILRHRSFSFQEFSQRYADATVMGDMAIRECRMQDQKNRQSSFESDDPALNEWWFAAQHYIADCSSDFYKQALDKGIAKEVARALLPEGLTPSRLYMSGNLRSWIHYVQLRTEAGTQKEHREIAEACKDWLLVVMPSLKELLDEET